MEQKEVSRLYCYVRDLFSQAAEMNILWEFMERLKFNL